MADFSGSKEEMSYHWTALVVVNNIGQIIGSLIVGELRKYLSFPILMLIAQGFCCAAFFYVLIFAKNKPKTDKKSLQTSRQRFVEAMKTSFKKRDGNGRLYIWILLGISFTGGLQLYGLPMLLAIYTVAYWTVIVLECHVAF